VLGLENFDITIEMKLCIRIRMMNLVKFFF